MRGWLLHRAIGHANGRSCSRPIRLPRLDWRSLPCQASRIRCCAANANTVGAVAPVPQGKEELVEASPLEDVCLYNAPKELGAVSAAAYRNCQIGAALGLLGFAGTGLGVAAAGGHPALLAVLGFGALANLYKQLVFSKTAFARSASRHVMELWLLQGGPEGVTAKEVHLKVLTTNLAIEMVLADQAAPWEGSRYAGFSADSRVPFGEACRNMYTMHIDISDPNEKAGTERIATTLLEMEAAAAAAKDEQVKQQQVEAEAKSESAAEDRSNVEAAQESEEATSEPEQERAKAPRSPIVELMESTKVVVSYDVASRADEPVGVLRSSKGIVEEMQRNLHDLSRPRPGGQKTRPEAGMLPRPADEIRQQGRLAVFVGLLLFSGGGAFIGRALGRASESSSAAGREDLSLVERFQIMSQNVRKGLETKPMQS